MLLKTHVTITVFAILIFISAVEYKISFVCMALIATLIPDLDSSFSFLGKYKIFRILQFFTEHRGLIHSFSFLFLITILLVLFFPILSLGFFVGYGFHLFADSFTKEGIQTFYPFKARTSGWVSTGGKTEISIFVVFILLDLFLIFAKTI
jgi:inner membrane protein